MANGGKDNGRFRTATLVNWHLLPEVELTTVRASDLARTEARLRALGYVD